jgi:uncharacterized membrane protein
MDWVGPLLVGLFVLGLLVILPIIALVQASAARGESANLRREVKRLEHLLQVLGERLGRAEKSMRPGEPPPAPAPPPPPVPETPSTKAVAALRRAYEPPETRETVPLPSPVPLKSEPVRPESMESFLGGRVFLVVGVMVALLGLGWFLKVAIDRNWITPGTRVAMGVAVGVAALIGGDRLRARGWILFGQGIMGGGLGALYVTTCFACLRFGFLDKPPASGALLLHPAGGAALAIAREAPLLAYLGFFGGFLAPRILSTGEDRVLELTAWVGVVDIGVLVVATKRPWRGLDLMAVLSSVFYFAGWLHRHYGPDRLGDGTTVLVALTALGLAVALVPPILRREEPAGTALFASLVAGAAAAMGGSHMLYPDHRVALGWGVAGLGAVYVLASRLVATRCNAVAAARILLSFSLACAALAVPYVFRGRAVAPAWSVAGFGLLLLVSRGAPGPVAVGGTGMLVLAAGEALFAGRFLHDRGMTPVVNAAFLSLLAPAVAMAASGALLAKAKTCVPALSGALLVGGAWLLAGAAGAEAWQSADDPARRGGAVPSGAAALAGAGVVLLSTFALRRAPEALRTLLLLPLFLAFLVGIAGFIDGHNGPFTPILHASFLCGLGTFGVALAVAALSPDPPGRIVTVAALVFLFALGTAEIFAWGTWRPLDGFTRAEAMFRAQVAASVAWALYAAVLVAAGFLLEKAEVRWTAIVLFGVTLAKVLLHDTARLDALYRVLSFVALGVLLVAASFLYQRRKAPR